VTLFSGRPLLALGRVYRFVGGVIGLQEVATDSRIQVVHDVGRMSELGSAGEIGRGGGLWYITVATTHVGAARVQETVNVYAAGGARGYNPLADEWVWYVSGMAKITVGANLDACLIGIHNQSSVSMAASSTEPGMLLLENWETASDTSIDGTSEPCIPSVTARNGPVLISRGESAGASSLRFVSDVSGAATTTISALVWKGKVGTYPPGYN